MTREEVLERFPDAHWMPGDPIPIGQRVSWEFGHNENTRRAYGRVVCFSDDRRKAPHHCTTCTCPAEPAIKGWWVITLEVPIPLHVGPPATEIIKYPPELRPE